MGGPTIVTDAGAEADGLALAASIAVSAALETPQRGALLVELRHGTARPRSSLLSTPAARELETLARTHGLDAAARGHICHLVIAAEPGSLETLSALIMARRPPALVIHVPPELWREAITHPFEAPPEGLIRLELPGDRSLAALAVAEARRHGVIARIARHAPSGIAGRRALAGLAPSRAPALMRRLEAAGRRNRTAADARSAAARPSESGQAMPAVLGVALLALGVALLLAAVGGAVTGKARAQRGADLVALSAARSMRDDLPRLYAPAILPGGSPNPRHLSRAGYLYRARAAALEAARRNNVGATRVQISFPRTGGAPPVRVRAELLAEIEGVQRVKVFAVAEAAPPSSGWTGLPAMASGGGYGGPLEYRNGEGMRPDVAGAFDLMAAAARRDGHVLGVNSGFRSDAEQAALFAAHPDPTWVAPPGRSLHRCGTELDLGPPAVYGWLAANASRFGFVQRYSWEDWHYGFDRGPAPCSAQGNTFEAGAEAGRGLPTFVPAAFADPLQRSAGRWGVSVALLAAQLEAESGFDPGAVSPVGAQGIAQFMPGTAASYGLVNPFDPDAAIDAQAHLMADLMEQFQSIPLALAAYNAGPGAVAACSCIPPYPETQAYVTRILALLNGTGALLTPALEVRLVK